MKKVKIMLTAMIILGTVGGVLAFKAKRLGLYCTAAIPTGPGGGVNACPDEKCLDGTIRKFTASGGVARCYKVTTNTANCNAANLDCTSNQTFTAD